MEKIKEEGKERMDINGRKTNKEERKIWNDRRKERKRDKKDGRTGLRKEGRNGDGWKKNDLERRTKGRKEE